jgi:hypothetical protein
VELTAVQAVDRPGAIHRILGHDGVESVADIMIARQRLPRRGQPRSAPSPLFLAGKKACFPPGTFWLPRVAGAICEPFATD